MGDTDTSCRGEVKVGESYWKWYGVWYKPWTWLYWTKVYIINEFQLWDFSFISNPTDPNTIIKIEDNETR